MRIIPLKEVAQRDAGEQLTAIRGVIKSVFDYYEGENSHGKWSLQTVVIDEAGTQLRLKVKDRPKITEASKGRGVVITAHQTPKGISGLKVEDDTYKGQTRKQVLITPSAVMEIDGMSGADPAPEPEPEFGDRSYSEADEFAPPDQFAPPPQQARPDRNTRPPAQAAPAPAPQVRTDSADQALKVDSTLFLRCFDAAAFIAREAMAKHSDLLGSLSASDVKEMAVTLFIERARSRR